MKKLLIPLMVISFMACQKSETTICNELTCQLIGEWNWTRTYGSIAGGTWTPESTGISKSLKISTTHLSFFQKDSLIQNTPYTLFESDTILGGDSFYKFISYDNKLRLYNIVENEFEMTDLCCDGYDDYYEKK